MPRLNSRTERPRKPKIGTIVARHTCISRTYLEFRRSKVKVARSRDTSDRFWPISLKQNVTETPKLVGKLSTPRAIMHTSFKVKGQRSRSPGRHNVKTGSVSYLPNGKDYELQTWYTDGGRRPVSATISAVTSKVKGQGRKVT